MNRRARAYSGSESGVFYGWLERSRTEASDPFAISERLDFRLFVFVRSVY